LISFGGTTPSSDEGCVVNSEAARAVGRSAKRLADRVGAETVFFIVGCVMETFDASVCDEDFATTAGSGVMPGFSILGDAGDVTG